MSQATIANGREMDDDQVTPGAIPSALPPNGQTTGVTVIDPTMQQKVHIKDIHVPLLLMLTFIVTILGGASTLAFGWYKLTEHAGDHEIQHPPVKAAVDGRGIAFKADVEAAESRMRQALRDSNKATRKMLTNQTITCTRTQRGLGCTVTVPEE